jgi:hypothetical protein
MKKIIIITSLIAITAAAAGVLFLWGSPKQADYGKLVGDWGRTDGDYIIRISAVNPDGTTQAAYFNPNPIHMASAKASAQNNRVKLFIELQDTGYPGCTYNLLYDPQQDILTGIYYQAAIQENFNVAFVRVKKP